MQFKNNCADVKSCRNTITSSLTVPSHIRSLTKQQRITTRVRRHSPFNQVVVSHHTILQVRLWGHVTTKGIFKMAISYPVSFPS